MTLNYTWKIQYTGTEAFELTHNSLNKMAKISQTTSFNAIPVQWELLHFADGIGVVVLTSYAATTDIMLLPRVHPVFDERRPSRPTVYPKKYAHGFVVLCFVVVMQSFIMNSHEVFIHIHQGCFAGTGAIVRLPQCQWSKPDGYGKISQCITTTKHIKAKTVCIFLGIYCMWYLLWVFVRNWPRQKRTARRIVAFIAIWW